MGQPLPLPERIPLPHEHERKSMIEKGFTFGEKKEIEGKWFTNYTLPDGWRFVDNSRRHDLPHWVFVGSDNMVYYAVCGAWKGTYDNDIEFYSVTPNEFKPTSHE
jgi:hypothetical protein